MRQTVTSMEKTPVTSRAHDRRAGLDSALPMRETLQLACDSAESGAFRWAYVAALSGFIVSCSAGPVSAPQQKTDPDLSDPPRVPASRTQEVSPVATPGVVPDPGRSAGVASEAGRQPPDPLRISTCVEKAETCMKDRECACALTGRTGCFDGEQDDIPRRRLADYEVCFFPAIWGPRADSPGESSSPDYCGACFEHVCGRVMRDCDANPHCACRASLDEECPRASRTQIARATQQLSDELDCTGALSVNQCLWACGPF